MDFFGVRVFLALKVLFQQAHDGATDNIVLESHQLRRSGLNPFAQCLHVNLAWPQAYLLEIDLFVVLVGPGAFLQHLFGLVLESGVLLDRGASNHLQWIIMRIIWDHR